eukprot:8173437-Pyramimonas_sp.AAC.1
MQSGVRPADAFLLSCFLSVASSQEVFLAFGVSLAHLAPPAPFLVEVRPPEPRAFARTEATQAVDLARAFST